jgi:hypothetical protein
MNALPPLRSENMPDIDIAIRSHIQYDQADNQNVYA